MSMIPNELLFEIFSHLEGPDRIAPCDRSRKTTTTKHKCDDTILHLHFFVIVILIVILIMKHSHSQSKQEPILLMND